MRPDALPAKAVLQATGLEAEAGPTGLHVNVELALAGKAHAASVT